MLEHVVLQPGTTDTHIWRLSSSGTYSTRSTYKALFQGAIDFELDERVWKSWAPGKCNFFVWLVEHNRCWTSDRLARRDMDHMERCPCDQHDEMINHLQVSFRAPLTLSQTQGKSGRDCSREGGTPGAGSATDRGGF
jgi:hypothetical protein